jgi:membrane protease YdiL (CAAX protease family)
MKLKSFKCYKCSTTLIFPLGNYCSNCGVYITPFHGLHVRWFGIVFLFSILIGYVVSNDIGIYMSNIVLGCWIIFVVIRNRISFILVFGAIPRGYNWFSLVFLVIFGVVFSVGTIPLTWYPISRIDPELVNEILSETISDSRVNLFIFIVLMAPVLEEIIFRGIIFTRFSLKWGNKKAILVSSLIFGILHVDPIGATVFGVLTCILYIRTNTLIVPIVLHSMNNGIAWLLSNSSEMQSFNPEELLPVSLVAIVLSLPVLIFILRRWWPLLGHNTPYQLNKQQNDLREYF